MFGELWKRKQAVIAWEWDLESFEEEEQPMPEYVAKVEKEKGYFNRRFMTTYNLCYNILIRFKL